MFSLYHYQRHAGVCVTAWGGWGSAAFWPCRRAGASQIRGSFLLRELGEESPYHHHHYHWPPNTCIVNGLWNFPSFSPSTCREGSQFPFSAGCREFGLLSLLIRDEAEGNVCVASPWVPPPGLRACSPPQAKSWGWMVQWLGSLGFLPLLDNIIIPPGSFRGFTCCNCLTTGDISVVWKTESFSSKPGVIDNTPHKKLQSNQAGAKPLNNEE